MCGNQAPILTALLAIASCLTSYDTSATFVTKTFAVPGAFETYFWGMNDDGDIVGDFSILNANGSGTTNHGLLISAGSWSAVDVPNIESDRLTDINNSRQYVGYGVGNHTEDSFFFDGTVYQTINYPGADLTRVWGLNDNGDMVGEFSMTPSSGGGFLYSNGTFTQITIPDAINVFPYGINNHGAISGLMRDSNNKFHGFIYDGVQAVLVDVLGSPLTAIYGLNDGGDFAGGIDNPAGSLRQSFARIGGIDEALVGYYSEARGINNQGDVVGWKLRREGAVAYVACPMTNGSPTTCDGIQNAGTVPEPNTLFLMALGAAALTRGSVRRRSQ